MTRFIACVSAKGGVGKTTTAINLGIALHNFKQSVIVVDANTTTPGVGIALGAPTVDIGLNDIVKKGSIEDAVHYHDSGLKVIPSRLDLKERSAKTKTQLGSVINKLGGMADIALFDSSAGVTEEARVLMESVDELLVITTPDPLSVIASLKTVKIAEEMGKDITGIVVTRRKSSTAMSTKSIENTMGYPVIGEIPEDGSVLGASLRQNAVSTLFPNAPASVAYRNLAAFMIDEPYYEPIPRDGMLKRVMKAVRNE